MHKKIDSLIKQGESLRIEFKEAQGGVPKSLYETVCSFSNTCGGYILLGVSDTGRILGIKESDIERYKTEFFNNVNNSNKMEPTLHLVAKECMVQGKCVLIIEVPESSEVHKCNGKIYVRVGDGDVDITNKQPQLYALYIKKQKTYTENEIIPGITLDDLRPDLITEARKRALVRNPDHVWGRLNDMELLVSASLYRKDFTSNAEGFTLASVLLLGRDEVIWSVLPHFKTDLIFRVENTDRYDDRDEVRTNLIDTYDRIMAFVQKHLPEKFHLSDSVRVDIRSVIFREIAVNLLIHREYTNPVPARFIIERDRILTDNGNKPFLYGNINPDGNMPYPKNPNIAKFFKEIGLAEELGSGIRNIFKYAKLYADGVPVVVDDSIFKLDWPIKLFVDKLNESKFGKQSDQASDQVSDQVSDQADREIDDILVFLEKPRSLMELLSRTSYSSRVYFMKKVLKPLIDAGVVIRTVPDKPNSPKQKYKINPERNSKQISFNL